MLFSDMTNKLPANGPVEQGRMMMLFGCSSGGMEYGYGFSSDAPKKKGKGVKRD